MGFTRTRNWLLSAALLTCSGLAATTAAQVPATAPAFPIGNVPQVKSTVIETPALIVRPSVKLAEHLDDCIVELKQPSEYYGQVTLKIMVPDSVDMIEVVPNQQSGSERNFRVRVDRNQTAMFGQERNPQKSATIVAGASSQTNARFKSNPFFQMMKRPSQTLPKVTQTSANLAPERKVKTANYSSESTKMAGKFTGPSNVVLGETHEFAISIPAKKINGLMEVALGVTDGFEIVVVDRDVTVDQEKKTINWRLENVQPTENILLQFKAKAKRDGYFTQSAKIKVNGQDYQTVQLRSVVKLGNASTNAPLLPYE